MASEQQRAVAGRIRADRQFWQELVAEVGRERMNEPGPMGEWTFKDLTSHLAAWRNARIPAYEAVGRGEQPPATPWPPELDDDDEINAWLQQRDRGLTVDEALAAYEGSFERLAAAIEALPEAVAQDPNAFPFLNGTAVVDVDFTEHLHEEHEPSIRAWLAERAG
jgi:hypothetical protein